MPHSFTFIALLLAAPVSVKSHGYMQSPRSRNYVAYRDGLWSGGDASTPAPESCPHCLNIGGTEGVCGVTGSTNYNTPLNINGEPLGTSIQETYVQGQEIDFEVLLSAHHKGHFTFKACAINPGEVATQACFDANKLTFTLDHFYGAPKDENYPERAYIPLSNYPGLRYESGGVYGSFYKYRYKLPDNLVGDYVLIQWYYLTANSCSHPGYNDYPFPQGFNNGNLAPCANVPPDGRGVPEQFWNCAEVKIVPSGPTAPTAPTTDAPVPSPILPPVASPVSQPTPGGPSASANYCGSSWTDAKNQCATPCPTGNSTVCPSLVEHCYADVPCTDNPVSPSSSSPSSSPTNSLPTLPKLRVHFLEPAAVPKGTKWQGSIKFIVRDENSNKVQSAEVKLRVTDSTGDKNTKTCTTKRNGSCVVKTSKYTSDVDFAEIKMSSITAGEEYGEYDSNLNVKDDNGCPVLSSGCNTISIAKP